jgi:uncharacterized circularly permuted ATP-grasp superfamily protein
MIRRAIDRYHELISGPLGGESARAFLDAARAERLTFGDRPICLALRPFFLAPEEAARLKSDAETLSRAFRKLLGVLGGDARFRSALRLSAAEEAVLAADRQPFEPDQIARLDGFLVRGGPFRVIEYNAESPGGIAFGDALAGIFRRLPVMEAFAREYEIATYDGLANTLRQLLHAHERRLGRPPQAPPAIAIVDWKSAPTRREFELCAESFTRRGFPSRVVEPDELRFEGGRLTAGGASIDVVYKRVLVGDLVVKGGADHPLVRAVAAGAVTCASRFQVHLLFRKELFAFFHDERLAHHFAEDEKDAIRRLVPWSRIVEDVEVTDGGAPQRLFDAIRRRRERLVLKPTDQYGGKGVVLGWLAHPEEWERTLQAARSEPYLVQERVQLPSERFPLVQDGAVAFGDFYADIDPYIWGGARSEGFGARLAPGELLNVTAGGGSAAPVFVVSPKSG